MSDAGEAIGGLIGLFLILAVVVLILYLLFLALQVLIAGGALFGAGISLRNYVLAFTHNVKAEMVKS